jgi:RNA polymerase sigma-70 factor (ECF subfamily)
VHSLARRFGGLSDAEEMTQEVFVRAWEKLPSFRGESAFGTWLYRMALNLLLTRWRSQRSRQARFIDDPAQVERAMQTTAARPAKPDLLMDLERAIGRLPEGARHVYVLHDVEGYRHEEIADLLGINPGTSKSQLHRARTVLRAFLAPALSHDSDKVEGDELDAHGGELGRPA